MFRAHTHTHTLTNTYTHTHLAVDLAAAQGGLDDVEQSICQAVTLPHPSSCLLTCGAYIPATHTHKEQWSGYVRVCLCV